MVICQQHKPWQSVSITIPLAPKGMLVPVVDLVLLVDGHQDEEHEEEQPKRKGSSMQ